MRSDGLGGTVTTDAEYPACVAFVLLGELLEEFTTVQGDSWQAVTAPDSISFPPMDDYLHKYQDPAMADKVTKIQKGLSLERGLNFLSERASTCIRRIHSLLGALANVLCPSNWQTRRLLCLVGFVFFSFTVLVSIGGFIGYALAFHAYLSILGCSSGPVLYFNTTQDLGASLPSDFLASCPSYRCFFSSHGAQCHCDAADVFIGVDGEVWTDICSNAQPADDLHLQSRQVSYVVRLRANVGIGPVDISFADKENWVLVSATCTGRCLLTGKSLKWDAPIVLLGSVTTDVTLTFRGTGMFYQPKVVKTKIFVPTFGLILRGRVKVESVGYANDYTIEALGGSAMGSGSILVLFSTGPWSRSYGIVRFLELPAVGGCTTCLPDVDTI